MEEKWKEIAENSEKITKNREVAGNWWNERKTEKSWEKINPIGKSSLNTSPIAWILARNMTNKYDTHTKML